MAPQYFFYNLPASESKDILQHILDHGAAHCKGKKTTTPILETDSPEEQAYERCVIQ